MGLMVKRTSAVVHVTNEKQAAQVQTSVYQASSLMLNDVHLHCYSQVG